MQRFTPNSYLAGGPVPVGSAVKDPRVVSLPVGTDLARVGAENGAGVHIWRRTAATRPFEGLMLHEYVYVGPAGGVSGP